MCICLYIHWICTNVGIVVIYVVFDCFIVTIHALPLLCLVHGYYFVVFCIQ